MTTFKKLNTNIYQKSGPEITPDYVYWKKLGAPVLIKEFGPIDHIDFSPIEPHHFAITCSVRVLVYNPITKLVVKNLSRFRENAYGATFRSDGKLICAGGEEASVKLFDVGTKSLLRLFKGHTAPVHRTLFLPNRPQIASYSDDKTVKIWDIPTEKDVITYTGHTDYIRAGAVCSAVPDMVLSAGYDGAVRMYDSRTQSECLTVQHGSPVEAVLFLPAGGVFLSAGGTDIKIWDAIAGGRLLGSISQHHKTITCLQLATNNTRLLSGSLDRHVKIYDLATYKTVHTLDYPNGVLSLGVSADDDTVVAGLVDGLVAIGRREGEKVQEKKVASFKHTARQLASVDAVVPQLVNETERKYDKCLRKFEFSKALDCVLVPYVMNKNPQQTVALMQELIRRNALEKALTGSEAKSVKQLLRFLIKYIPDVRFTRILVDVADVFLDVYEKKTGNYPSDVLKLIVDLNVVLKQELDTSGMLASLEGAMHMLLAAHSASEQSREEFLRPQAIVPSADAQKNLVVTIN